MDFNTWLQANPSAGFMPYELQVKSYNAWLGTQNIPATPQFTNTPPAQPFADYTFTTHTNPNYSSGTAQAQTSSSSGAPLPLGNLAIIPLQVAMAIKAKQDIKKTPNPDFGITNEMGQSVSEAASNRRWGFTPSERGAYEQKLGSDKDVAYTRAVSLAGDSMSKAINAILTGQQVNQRNQLAVADAQIRRSNIAASDALNSQVQSINNMNVSRKQMEYDRKQQAYAQLVQSILGNFAGVGNMAGSVALKAATMGIV